MVGPFWLFQMPEKDSFWHFQGSDKLKTFLEFSGVLKSNIWAVSCGIKRIIKLTPNY